MDLTNFSQYIYCEAKNKYFNKSGCEAKLFEITLIYI